MLTCAENDNVVLPIIHIQPVYVGRIYSKGRHEITGGLQSATCCPRISKKSIFYQASKAKLGQG